MSKEGGERKEKAVQTTSTVDSRMVVMTRGTGSVVDRFLARLHPYHRLFNLLSPLSAWLAPAAHELHLHMLSTAANYTVHASMRGMRKTDITVLVSDGFLFIEAEKKQPTQGGSPQLTAVHTPSVLHSLPPLGGAAAAPEEQSGMVESERRQTAMAAQPADAQLRYGETGSDRVESCILLPADSDVTALTARWVDGVLEVVIPRKQREASEAMNIEVL